VTWHTGGSTLHKTLNLTTAPNNLPRNWSILYKGMAKRNIFC
jgi:hypothetical protein